LKPGLLFAALLLTTMPAPAEQSAELHLLLEGTERFQQNVLELEADLLRLEQDSAHPERGRASLFLNTALGGRYRLEEIAVQLDGEPLLKQSYSLQQRRALSQGTSQPLKVLSLPPGEHVLKIDFMVGEGQKRHRGHSELKFRHGKQETWIELRVEDVPGEIFSPQQPDGTQTETPRRVEMTVQAWEAPK